jgi:hypothetical protein
MGKKVNREEELLNRIREFKREFRSRRTQELLDEREERHNRGEVFFGGYWVPKESLSTILKRLRTRGRIVFIEVHLFFFFSILASLIIWFIFKRFFLP